MNQLKKIFNLIGLTQSHRITLDVSRDVFIRLLRAHVGKDISSSLDVFAGNVDYRGEVGESGFYLRRTRGFMTNTRHFCKANGTFHEDEGKLIIDIEFSNFSPPVYAFLVLSVVFLSFPVINILLSLLRFNFSDAADWIFSLFSAAVVFFIISAVIHVFSTKTITKMKYEMETNFRRYVYEKI